MLNLKRFSAIAETKTLLIIKAVMFCLTVAVFLTNVFFGFEYDKVLFTVTAFVAMSSLLVATYYCRNNWCAVIIFAMIFATIYSAWVDGVWFIFFRYEMSLASTAASIRMMCAYAIFTLTMLMFVRSEYEKKEESKDSLLVRDCYNPLIVGGIILVLILIFLFVYKAPEGGSTRGEANPLYEYSLILFIFAYMYSGRRWYTVVPITVLLLAFAAKDLLYGGRKTALSLVILFFIIFLSHRMSFIKVLPLALVGLVVFSAVGHFRGNADFSIEQIKITLKVMLKQKFAVDTMYSASYTGISFVAAASEGIYSVSERLMTFMRFLASMILGGGRVPNSNVSLMTHDYYSHWYGGVLPAYGYFFLGWLGTALTGALAGIWIKLADTKRTPLKQVLLLWVTCTCFNWVMYSPSSLIRGVLFMLAGYFICLLGDKLSRWLLSLFAKKA